MYCTVLGSNLNANGAPRQPTPRVRHPATAANLGADCTRATGTTMHDLTGPVRLGFPSIASQMSMPSDAREAVSVNGP